MDLLLIGVIVVTFIGAKVNFAGEGYLDTYLNRKQTTAVNGVFVMLVFLRHFKEYIECGTYDRFFWSLDSYLGQLIVTTFLFYSGYGMLVSLKNKPHYLQSVPKRFFKVWFQFAMAICLFLILNMVMGTHYSCFLLQGGSLLETVTGIFSQFFLCIFSLMSVFDWQKEIESLQFC